MAGRSRSARSRVRQTGTRRRPDSTGAPVVRTLAVLLCAALAATQDAPMAESGQQESAEEAGELRVCVDHDPATHSHFLPVALAAGFAAAAAHVQQRSCRFIPACTSLLRVDELSVKLIDVSSNLTALDAAASAVECQRRGGQLYLLGTESLVDTVVPFNTVNHIVSGAAALSRPAAFLSHYFRTHLSPTVEATDVALLSKHLGWTRLLVLFNSADVEFAHALEGEAIDMGIETALFLVSEDIGSKLEAMQKFGASIIVFASHYDASGSSQLFHETLEAMEGAGFMDPQYTWLAAYHLSRINFGPYLAGSAGADKADRLTMLLEGMIFMKTVPEIQDATLELWESIWADQKDHLHELWPAIQMEEMFDQIAANYLPELAMAYDTLWLAASTYTAYLADQTTGPSTGDFGSTWQTYMSGIVVEGLSGSVEEDENFYRIDSGHTLELFVLDPDTLKIKVISIFNSESSIGEITLPDGVDGFLWRDGTSYPGSIPVSDITVASIGTSRTVMWVSVAVSVVFLSLFFAVGLGQLKLRRSLSAVAADTDQYMASPLTQAADMLKELSRSVFLSRSVKKRIREVAIKLISAEDVHRPDLVAQLGESHKDIVAHLMGQGVSSSVPRDRHIGTVSRMSMVQSDSRSYDGADTGRYSVDYGLPSLDDLPAVDVTATQGAGEDLFFDTLAASKALDGRVLFGIAVHVIESLGIGQYLTINMPRFCRFVVEIEAGYDPDIPYHNSTHAADVLSRVCAILSTEKVIVCDCKEHALLLLGVSLAAIVHDFKHPGLGNGFQVATSSDISREFNEQNVLENLSLHRSLEILRRPDLKFLSVSSSDFQRLCSIIIQLVLATDMSRHFEVLSAFKAKVPPLKQKGLQKVSSSAKKRRGLNGKRTTAVVESDVMSRISMSIGNQTMTEMVRRFESSAASMTFTGAILPNSMDDKAKCLFLQLALKVADIGHMATENPQHIQWSQRLENEFFAQGDKERELHLPISPLMNRNKPGVMHPGNQKTFANVIVIPMLETWAMAAPVTGQVLLAMAIGNRRAWERKLLNMGEEAL